MYQTIIPLSGPKLRLVEAAEKLFADQGFDSVSVRDITKEANANVAAVNYHFGSRDGLVSAVMTRYLNPVHQDRCARLEASEKKWAPKPVPVEEVMDAYVSPLVTQVRKSEMSEKLFCKLLGRILSEQGGALHPEVQIQFLNGVERFLKTLTKSLPTPPYEDLVWRFHFISGAMIHMMTHGETLQAMTKGANGITAIDTTISRFLRFATIALSDGVEGVEIPPAPKVPQATFSF